MSFAGVDFSTHSIDVVLLPDDGSATYHRFELTGSDAFERTRAVRDALPSRSDAFWDEVVALGIEEPQGVAKSTVAKLKAVQGAVLACLPSSLLVEPMVPARWRTAVGLPGNASKREIYSFVAGRHTPRWSQEQYHPALRYPTSTNATQLIWPQDAADAYCLALAVSKLTEGVAA